MYTSLPYKEQRFDTIKESVRAIYWMGSACYTAKYGAFSKVCTIPEDEENLPRGHVREQTGNKVLYSRDLIVDAYYKRLVCTVQKRLPKNHLGNTNHEFLALLNFQGTSIWASRLHNHIRQRILTYFRYSKKYFVAITDKSLLIMISIPLGKTVGMFHLSKIFGPTLQPKTTSAIHMLSPESRPGVAVMVCKDQSGHWTAAVGHFTKRKFIRSYKLDERVCESNLPLTQSLRRP